MPTTLEATSHHSSRKSSIFLSILAIQNHSFHYETPCRTKHYCPKEIYCAVCPHTTQFGHTWLIMCGINDSQKNYLDQASMRHHFKYTTSPIYQLVVCLLLTNIHSKFFSFVIFKFELSISVMHEEFKGKNSLSLVNLDFNKHYNSAYFKRIRYV